MSAEQASKAKDVSTVGEPLLDDNPDRYCMFPIRYPVSNQEDSGRMPAGRLLDEAETAVQLLKSASHTPM